MHHDSAESADPLLSAVTLMLVRVLLQPPSLSGMPIALHYALTSLLVDCHQRTMKSPRVQINFPLPPPIKDFMLNFLCFLIKHPKLIISKVEMSPEVFHYIFIIFIFVINDAAPCYLPVKDFTLIHFNLLCTLLVISSRLPLVNNIIC